MPIPSFSKAVAGAVKGAVKSTPIGGFASGLAAAVAGGAEGEDKPKRHRRKSLTKGQMSDVIFLSNNISKKAAENYLLTHS